MSTLTRTKGILELLQAVELLRPAWPAVHLAVAGQWQEDDLRREALALIESRQLTPHVTFLGNADGEAKASFLAQGDVFCLPTRYPYEGQPLVILEAMAAGLPVLSTDRGVIAQTVLDGQTGRILPAEATPQAIAEALDSMLKNADALRAWGAAARQRYLEHYTLELCHQRLFRVLQQAAGR
jgi:glycosyltransferase involved in cell wall biosynthesis